MLTLLHRDETTPNRLGPCTPRQPAVRRRLGPYQLLRELGRGGMSRVSLALRVNGEGPRQRVAVKWIRKTRAEGEVARFVTEHHILARLDHPNIVRVLDTGETDDGYLYFVLEHVDGERVDRYCAQRSVSLRERLGIFATLCSAVDHAHRRGIVHRDIKPGNVLVDLAGVVKLMDFGIAKVLAGAEVDAPAITLAGQRLMTPQYASPEQIEGRAITPATDVHGLGLLLFELLTGERAFELKDLGLVEMVRVVCDLPAPVPSERLARQASPAVRAEPERLAVLDAIVARALAKDPAERYGSCREMAADVGRFLAHRPLTPWAPPVVAVAEPSWGSRLAQLFGFGQAPAPSVS